MKTTSHKKMLSSQISEPLPKMKIDYQPVSIMKSDYKEKEIE